MKSNEYSFKCKFSASVPDPPYITVYKLYKLYNFFNFYIIIYTEKYIILYNLYTVISPTPHTFFQKLHLKHYNNKNNKNNNNNKKIKNKIKNEKKRNFLQISIQHAFHGSIHQTLQTLFKLILQPLILQLLLLQTSFKL